MSSQLDILCLEPFYGGPRRAMLETLIRCSRHRWTLLKLPPRKIERRLTTAALWFAEQLNRHWTGRFDLLFTSEAMNLTELFRRVPKLAKRPAVVYFHSNQLPHSDIDEPTQPWQTANLSTALSATEIWFNSQHHLDHFIPLAKAVLNRTPELQPRDLLPSLQAKAHVYSPPVDLSLVHEYMTPGMTKSDRRIIFVETRDADVTLLNGAFKKLRARGEAFRFVTVGPAADVAPDLPRLTLHERDDAAHARALVGAGVFVSVRPDAHHDAHTIRALAGRCWPILPNTGVYSELIPPSLHATCLYDPTPTMLANRLEAAWAEDQSDLLDRELSQWLTTFDAVTLCKRMDARIEELAVGHSLDHSRAP